MLSVLSAFAGTRSDSLLSRLDDADGRERIDILNNLSLAYYEERNAVRCLEFAKLALSEAEGSLSSMDIAQANNNLGNAYMLSRDYDKAHDAYHEALKTAQESNLTELEARIFNNLGKIYFMKGKYRTSIDYYQQSFNIYQKSDNKVETAKVYNNFGAAYSAMEQYDMALYFYNKALDIRQALGQKDDVSKLLYNIGLLYSKWGNYEKALEFNLRSLNIRKGQKDTNEIAKSYNNIGYLYYKWGKYDKSLENYLDGLRYYESMNSSDDVARTLNIIGQVYYDWGNYTKAIEQYKRALEIVSRAKDSVKIARTNTNIGNIYYDSGNYDKALEFYNKSLDITENALERYVQSSQKSREKQTKKGIATLMNNIGLVYKKKGNYTKALNYCKKALQIKEELGHNEFLFFPLTSIGQIYSEMGDYANALVYARQSLELAKDFNNIKLIRDAHYTLYEINKAAGNYSAALDNHLQFTDLKDSLLNEETNKRFVEMEVKYETEKKAREIESKQVENKRLMETNAQQRSYFFVISGLILILLVVIFSRYRSKQKANELLSEKNEQITKQSAKMKTLIKQLKDSEKKLKEANVTKDKFFSIIAHDLKNPLQTLLLSADLLVRFGEKFNRIEIDEKHHFIRKTAKQLSYLLESLLQWARTQTGKIEYKPKNIDLNLVLLENINLLSSSAFKKNINIISEVRESTYVFVDENMVKTIFRNLISNAIKFTPANGYVTITSKDRNDFVEISVIDTGIGISEENLPKLFRIDVHHTTIGTSNEKGTGLGLILCKEFVEKNGGNIKVESTIEEGSRFTFTLPKSGKKDLIAEENKVIR